MALLCQSVGEPERRLSSDKRASVQISRILEARPAVLDPGCAKTRAFNSLVESSSQFGQSAAQIEHRLHGTFFFRLSERAHRVGAEQTDLSRKPGTNPDPS